MACTVVQAVVKANSQSNGKGHTSKSMWRCDNVGGLGEHVKKHLLWLLRCTFFKFFALFFGSRSATSGPILTIYTSYDVFLPKDVPFGVSFILLPILG